MSGPLGTSGGGAAGVTSVTAGNGITVTGTTTPTIAASLAAGTGVSIAGTTTLTVTNTGVTSLAGTGVSVSAATGAVTITAPVVAGGTGISVSGSQTTSLTVTNSGVTALAGTGISVSAATGSVTVTPTYAAPTALTIGGTVVTGAAASVANSAHVHAMPGSAVAGASAVGDTAATGSATTVALSDHRHSREAFGTPGAVTGGATAASGSATTIARSDHVHSTASMPVLLASTTLASDAATISFTSIVGTYKHLKLIGSLRSSYAGPYDLVRAIINSDTASNYYSSQDGSTSTEWRWAVVSGATDYLASAGNGSFDINLPGYASTSSYKFFTSFMAHPYSTTSTRAININYFGGYWLSTSAITSIALSSANGSNFKSGGIVSLYGYP